ncbi:MAG: hemerythrin family protein [Magnetococcales bacterium]|nr:hemerythrin family protein [Magnetococcales bacterium]
MASPYVILWKSHLSVGVADVDEDHKKLIKMINRLFGAALSLEPQRVLEGVLDELTRYVIFHFEREEEYMLRLGYSAYLEHQREHQRLLVAVARFRERLLAGKVGRLKEEMEATLRDWLVGHILEMDKKMGEFLNSQGIY